MSELTNRDFVWQDIDGSTSAFQPTYEQEYYFYTTGDGGYIPPSTRDNLAQLIKDFHAKDVEIEITPKSPAAGIPPMSGCSFNKGHFSAMNMQIKIIFSDNVDRLKLNEQETISLTNHTWIIANDKKTFNIDTKYNLGMNIHRTYTWQWNNNINNEILIFNSDLIEKQTTNYNTPIYTLSPLESDVSLLGNKVAIPNFLIQNKTISGWHYNDTQWLTSEEYPDKNGYSHKALLQYDKDVKSSRYQKFGIQPKWHIQTLYDNTQYIQTNNYYSVRYLKAKVINNYLYISSLYNINMNKLDQNIIKYYYKVPLHKDDKLILYERNPMSFTFDEPLIHGFNKNNDYTWLREDLAGQTGEYLSKKYQSTFLERERKDIGGVVSQDWLYIYYNNKNTFQINLKYDWSLLHSYDIPIDTVFNYDNLTLPLSKQKILKIPDNSYDINSQLHKRIWVPKDYDMDLQTANLGEPGGTNNIQNGAVYIQTIFENDNMLLSYSMELKNVPILPTTINSSYWFENNKRNNNIIVADEKGLGNRRFIEHQQLIRYNIFPGLLPHYIPLHSFSPEDRLYKEINSNGSITYNLYAYDNWYKESPQVDHWTDEYDYFIYEHLNKNQRVDIKIYNPINFYDINDEIAVTLDYGFVFNWPAYTNKQCSSYKWPLYETGLEESSLHKHYDDNLTKDNRGYALVLWSYDNINVETITEEEFNQAFNS